MRESTVRLELFGMPRVIAGTDHAKVTGTSLREILDQAIAQYPALAQHLLRDDTGWLNGGYTFVVNGAFTSDPEYPVPPNASVFLVSKASGG
jgi:molybdopterin converting factor small subunit